MTVGEPLKLVTKFAACVRCQYDHSPVRHVRFGSGHHSLDHFSACPAGMWLKQYDVAFQSLPIGI
jgi:hypothetical protein